MHRCEVCDLHLPLVAGCSKGSQWTHVVHLSIQSMDHKEEV